jgi:arylsulfatase A-like enzyme
MKASILFMAVLCLFSCSGKNVSPPNIIIILADDMGYGDVQAYHSPSDILTPNLNKLSEEGIMFMDAHTPASICTPTRYGLLTGRYCWRSSLKNAVLKGYDPPLIEKGRITIADYLKGKGYVTGIVGKWHLGLGFQQYINQAAGGKVVFDLTKPLHNSPNNYGFDYSFILPASLDFEPYVYVRNYEVVDNEFDSVPTTQFPHFWRAGIKSSSLDFEQVLDDLLVEAQYFIKKEAQSNNPFFLYFSLTAPHKPVIPNEKFEGTSGKGLYGDFVMQIDWTTGEILNMLETLGISNNTLIIFTSDNGSPMYRINSTTGPDHVTDETLAYYNVSSHEANGLLRGIKGDTYEGGHRVPFIARWPERIRGGEKVNVTICLTDIFETIIEITEGVKPAGSAEDSYSFMSELFGQRRKYSRPPVIHHSGGKGMFAIRDGRWKMILGNGSGARTKPVGTPFGEPYQLYDLENDLEESTNLIESESEISEKLEAAFFEIYGNELIATISVSDE